VVDPTMDALTWLRKPAGGGLPGSRPGHAGARRRRADVRGADALCGAPYGERSPERITKRNGYRPRRRDTRAGSIELEIPKLRQGSSFPDWLLLPRRRAEQALMTAIAGADLAGVPTRREEVLVKALGIEGIWEEPGLGDRRPPGRGGGGLPGPTARRPLPLRLAGCPGGALPRRPGAHERRGLSGRRRGQRRGQARGPRPGAGQRRGRRGMARLPARPHRRRPAGCAAGHLRRPPRPGGGRALGARPRRLAALSHALPQESPDQGAQVGPAPRGHPGALDLRPARRAAGGRPARAGGRAAGGALPGRRRAPRRGRAGDPGLHRLPKDTGARSGPPTRRSA
jgi:mutator family transposase